MTRPIRHPRAAHATAFALWAACTALLPALIGCGGSNDGSTASAPVPAPVASSPTSPPSPPSPPPTTQLSDGCGKTAPGQTTNLHVKDGRGVERTFEVIVSPGYDTRKATAVVFDFHGAGGQIQWTEADGFQDAIRRAGDQGIVVIPQGMPYQNYGVGWDESCSGYDVAFFDEMLRYVKANYCVDTKKVFAAGFSWGSDMTNALACCRGSALKGVAPFSGPERMNRSCPTPASQFPSVRYRYGTADFAYGTDALAQHDATLSFYRQQLSCSAASDPAAPSPCKTYRSCSATLMECRIEGLGHSSISPTEADDTWKLWRSLP